MAWLLLWNVKAPRVASANNQLATSCGVGASARLLMYLATVPATWGVAIDVPEYTAVPPLRWVDRMSTPGNIHVIDQQMRKGTVLHRDTDVWQSQLPARPSQLPARPSKMTGAAI